MLSDAAARDAYDSQRSAALKRQEERRAMDAKKRAMVDDLEARERGDDKRQRTDRPTMSEAERRRLLEAGKRRMEERQRLMREAEQRERQREEASRESQQSSKPPDDTPDDVESKMDIDHEPPASNGDGDGYDDRIADLERRLRKAKERKAARKDDKKRKPARKGGDNQEAQAQATPLPDISQERKADEKKGAVPSTKPFSFSPAAAGNGASTGRVKGDFSSTMARLRAAQAEKEARKKAEETAIATDSINS